MSQDKSARLPKYKALQMYDCVSLLSNQEEAQKALQSNPILMSAGLPDPLVVMRRSQYNSIRHKVNSWVASGSSGCKVEQSRRAQESYLRAAKIAGIPSGRKLCTHIWRSLGHRRCAYCSTLLREEPGLEKSLTLDHIVPRTFGGPATYLNTLIACAECNKAKGCQDLDVFTHLAGLPRAEWLRAKNAAAKTHMQGLLVITGLAGLRPPTEEEISLAVPCWQTHSRVQEIAADYLRVNSKAA